MPGHAAGVEDVVAPAAQLPPPRLGPQPPAQHPGPQVRDPRKRPLRQAWEQPLTEGPPAPPAAAAPAVFRPSVPMPLQPALQAVQPHSWRSAGAGAGASSWTVVAGRDSCSRLGLHGNATAAATSQPAAPPPQPRWQTKTCQQPAAVPLPRPPLLQPPLPPTPVPPPPPPRPPPLPHSSPAADEEAPQACGAADGAGIRLSAGLACQEPCSLVRDIAPKLAAPFDVRSPGLSQPLAPRAVRQVCAAVCPVRATPAVLLHISVV